MKYAAYVIGAVVGLSYTARALADRDFTWPEKNKILDVLDLIEETLRKNDTLGQTLTSRFTTITSPGGAGIQTAYEPAGATYRDLLDTLRNMLDQDRIRVAPKTSSFNGQAQRKKGIDADTIRINETLIANYCAQFTNNPASDPAAAMVAKAQLAGTLMNEGVHVFQELPSTSATDEQKDLMRCDAERDSDSGSLDFLGPFGGVFEFNTSPSDINATECPLLAACMARAGVTEANFEAVGQAVNSVGSGYVARQSVVFDPSLNGSMSWSVAYYGEPTKPESAGAKTTGNDSVRVELTPTTFQDYLLPSGQSVVRETLSTNTLGQSVLAVTASDAAGNMHLLLYVDTSGDGLPDEPPSTTAFPVQSPLPPDPGDVFMYPLLAGDELEASGWTLINTQTGDVFEVETNDDGQPAGPINLVFNDPNLAQNNAPFLIDHVLLDPVNAYYAFSSGPSHDDGAVPALGIYVDTLTRNWTAGPGPLNHAQAIAPNNPVAVDELGDDSVVLFGNPMESITMTSVGHGVAMLVASGTADASGLVSVMASSTASDLYFLQSLTSSRHMFLPEIGRNLACFIADENEDFIPDRLHLTTSPSRLHYFQGVAQAGAVQQYIFEQVLETEALRSLRIWDDDQGRHFAGMTGMTSLAAASTPVNGIPTYYTSLHDLDGDANPDEAVVAIRVLPARSFELQIIDGAPAAATVDQTFTISFEPRTIQIADLDEDGSLDIHVSQFPAGPGGCYFNDGSGNYVPGLCPAPCSGDSNSDGLVNIRDLNMVLGNFGQVGSPGIPGDLNLDGGVDIVDLNLVIGNFGSSCP